LGRLTRAVAAAGLVGALLIVATLATRFVGPAETRPASVPPSTINIDFPDSRVSVQVVFSRDYGRSAVIATFSPTDVGLHLYGTEMADTGIDGAGRPTRLRIVDSGWGTSGPVTANAITQDSQVAGFDRPFPIYPDGAVTLTQEVSQTDPTDQSIDVQIGFMACSSRGVCYAPVWDSPVTVGAG
jgi:hypothetical protein